MWQNLDRFSITHSLWDFVVRAGLLERCPVQGSLMTEGLASSVVSFRNDSESAKDRYATNENDKAESSLELGSQIE